jgi:hypothetical protein
VFSSVSGILNTPVGEALRNSFKNKTGIKLWGSIEHNQGISNILFTIDLKPLIFFVKKIVVLHPIYKHQAKTHKYLTF